MRVLLGIGAILFEIPTRYFYWDICASTWFALMAVDRKFLDHESARLAQLPEKFGLVRPGARCVRVLLLHVHVRSAGLLRFRVCAPLDAVLVVVLWWWYWLVVLIASHPALPFVSPRRLSSDCLPFVSIVESCERVRWEYNVVWCSPTLLQQKDARRGSLVVPSSGPWKSGSV